MFIHTANTFSFQVSLAMMKMRRDFPDLTGENASLEEANRKLEAENKKLKEESDTAKKTIRELEQKLKIAQGLEQKLKDVEESLKNEKKLRLITTSSLKEATENVDKVTHKAILQKRRADDAEKKTESVLQDLTMVRDNLARLREMFRQLEVRVLQARKEATEKTSNKFLYTLWKYHLELDFSFFGKEAVEEVKKYAVRAARKTQAKTAHPAQEGIIPTTPKKSSKSSSAQTNAPSAQGNPPQFLKSRYRHPLPNETTYLPMKQSPLCIRFITRLFCSKNR